MHMRREKRAVGRKNMSIMDTREPTYAEKLICIYRYLHSIAVSTSTWPWDLKIFIISLLASSAIPFPPILIVPSQIRERDRERDLGTPTVVPAERSVGFFLLPLKP